MITGVTPLYKAVQHNHMNCIKVLLSPVATSEDIPAEVSKGLTAMLSHLDGLPPPTLPGILKVSGICMLILVQLTNPIVNF